MKKYFLVIFSVFSVVVSFICFWFNDNLVDRYFVFGIIPVGLSFLMIVSGLFFSVTGIVRRRKDIKNYVSLLIAIVNVIIILFFPFRTARVNTELHLYEEERLHIVEMVASGDITADKMGNAELPREYRHISSDGNIAVYQNNEEQVICFWVFRGMLSGSVQLIYSSAGENLIYENETAHPITSVEMLKEHWYLVNTDY